MRSFFSTSSGSLSEQKHTEIDPKTETALDKASFQNKKTVQVKENLKHTHQSVNQTTNIETENTIGSAARSVQRQKKSPVGISSSSQNKPIPVFEKPIAKGNDIFLQEFYLGKLFAAVAGLLSVAHAQNILVSQDPEVRLMLTLAGLGISCQITFFYQSGFMLHNFKTIEAEEKLYQLMYVPIVCFPVLPQLIKDLRDAPGFAVNGQFLSKLKNLNAEAMLLQLMWYLKIPCTAVSYDLDRSVFTISALQFAVTKEKSAETVYMESVTNLSLRIHQYAQYQRQLDRKMTEFNTPNAHHDEEIPGFLTDLQTQSTPASPVLK